MNCGLFKIVITLLALVVSACASTRAGEIDAHSNNKEPPRISAPEYWGHYEFGFEVSAFGECGSSEVWWIARGSAMQPLHDFIDRRTGFTDDQGFVQGRVFVRWRGLVSAPGRYGQRNAYLRQFRVVEVLEVRMPSPDDCDRKG